MERWSAKYVEKPEMIPFCYWALSLLFIIRQNKTRSTHVNAHAKFGENPLMFTQVIIRKQKTDGRTDTQSNMKP